MVTGLANQSRYRKSKRKAKTSSVFPALLAKRGKNECEKEITMGLALLPIGWEFCARFLSLSPNLISKSRTGLFPISVRKVSISKARNNRPITLQYVIHAVVQRDHHENI